MSKDVHQRPDLLVRRSGMSTNVHWRPLTFEFVARRLARPELVSRSSHYSISRGWRWGVGPTIRGGSERRL